MANNEDKVKVELELSKNQVSIHAAGADPGSEAGSSETGEERTLEKLKEAREKLSETRQKLEEKEKQETEEKLKEARQKLKETREKLEEKEKDEEGEDQSFIKKTTGYEASEILAAPASPPEPEAKSKPKLGQLRLVLIGFVVVFIGVVFWPAFGFSVGISVIIAGAILVAIGVLVRI